jgi:hypothetical protein
MNVAIILSSSPGMPTADMSSRLQDNETCATAISHHSPGFRQQQGGLSRRGVHVDGGHTNTRSNPCCFNANTMPGLSCFTNRRETTRRLWQADTAR